MTKKKEKNSKRDSRLPKSESEEDTLLQKIYSIRNILKTAAMSQPKTLPKITYPDNPEEIDK